MSGESDAVGQLIDAGLLGSAMERGGGMAAHHDVDCANCGAALQGRYCQNCGQRGAVHRSLAHLLEEFFHGLFHFDGKLWRTAPLLLVRPGALTRRYVQGQRVRFVSPIALFLFSIFLMFFAVSTIDPSVGIPNKMALSATDREELKRDLEEAKADLQEAARDAADAKSAKQKARAEKALGAAQSAVEMAAKAENGGDEAAQAMRDKLAANFDWRDWMKRAAEKPNLRVLDNDTLTERMRESLRDPDLLLYKLKNTASEYSFLLVPMSVPFLWVMFLFRRRVYLYDHVIFALHSLSFMALFVSLCALAWKFNFGARLALAPILVPPLHMFFHLKGAYQLSVGGALWRTTFMLVVALIVLVIYVAVILVLGLLH